MYFRCREENLNKYYFLVVSYVYEHYPKCNSVIVAILIYHGCRSMPSHQPLSQVVSKQVSCKTKTTFIQTIYSQIAVSSQTSNIYLFILLLSRISMLSEQRTITLIEKLWSFLKISLAFVFFWFLLALDVD
jgi:hypothetical protein